MSATVNDQALFALQQENLALNRRMAELEARLAQLQQREQAYAQLEAHIAQRTNQLAETHHALSAEMAERVRAEEELRQSQALLQRLLDHAPAFIYARDADGRYTLVNRALAERVHARYGCAMPGKTPAEIYGAGPLINQLEVYHQHVLQTGETIEFEHVSPDGTGGSIYLLATKFPIYDRQGTIVAVGGITTDITARKQAEAALQASERRFRAIFEAAPVGIATAKRIVDECNAAFQQLLGYTSTELRQLSWEQITHPDDVPRERAAYREMLAQGTNVYTIEKRYIRKDGSPVWVRLTNALVRDELGAPSFGVAIVEDIDARKQAEQALAASEARYRTLVETSPCAILFTELDSTIRVANQQAAELFGYAALEDLVGTRLVDLVALAEVPGPLDLLRMIVDAGDIRNLEHTMSRRDGGTFAVEVCSSVVATPQGEPEALTIALRDISQRKHAEAALTKTYHALEALNHDVSQSRNLLQALFDGLNDGFVLLDSTGTIQIINRALATLLQSTPDEIVGQPWNAVYPRLIPEYPRAPELDASWYHESHPRRARHQHPDGTTAVLDIRTIALPGPAGRIDQTIVHVVDITEHLKLQAWMVENERFAASGRLASSVAHEINTPLLSLDLSLEMAQIAPSHEQPGFLAEARQEIQRIAWIVRQMLDLHRPSAAHPGLIDIGSLIERTLLLVGKWVREQHIVLEHDFAPDLPPLWGRSSELMQVLLNLMVNAVQAMPDGGTLTLRTAVASAAGTAGAADAAEAEAVLITISDNGCGIAPDLHDRIFEPFVTTRQEGTGLGLAISQQIIAQHGGTIRLVSEPGVGSHFTIVLPPAPQQPGSSYADLAASPPLCLVPPRPGLRHGQEHPTGLE